MRIPRLAESLLERFKLRSPCFYDVLWAMKGALSAATGIGLTRRIHLKNTVGIRLCTIIEGVDKLMTSRHLCAIRLHERKTAMP